VTPETDAPTAWAGSRRSRALAGILCGLNVLGFAGLLLLELRHDDSGAAGNFAQGLLIIVLFALLGSLLSLRQPANPIGWLLSASAVTWLVSGFAHDLAKYVPADRAVASVPARLAVGFSENIWPLGVVCGVGLPLLLFPAGRTRSDRWRWVLRAMISGCGLMIVASAFAPVTLPSPTDPAVRLHNPWGIESYSVAIGVIRLLATLAIMVTSVAAIVGIVVRFRSATGAERQQLRWVGAGAACAVSGILIFFFDSVLSAAVISSVFTLGFGCLPLSITIAILRYRLYDLDRIVSRTVTYASVSGLLVATYAGLVTAVSRFTPSSSSLSVAASTLAVAALFQPLRRRVQAVVDHRFNRAKYDAARTVEAFSARLREQVDLDEVRADLLAVVRETMQPASTTLWLRAASGTPR